MNFYTWNVCPLKRKILKIWEWYYHNNSIYSWNISLRVSKRNEKNDLLKWWWNLYEMTMKWVDLIGYAINMIDEKKSIVKDIGNHWLMKK